MATVIFKSENSVHGTITSMTLTPLGIYTYSYNSNLSSLLTNSILSIDNLNATFDHLSSISTYSKSNITKLQATSLTILII